MTRLTATITANFGRRMHIAFADGTAGDARIKGRGLKPVCADRVSVVPIDNDEWLIVEIHERRNALTRPNLRGAVEVLASNVDVVIVVAAPEPKPDWYIVDRYLCAAENMGAEAIVAWHKSDLPGGDEADAMLRVYRELGYGVARTSIDDPQSIAALERTVGSRVALLVGQSGVGKSSLINGMSPPSSQRTSGISRKTGEGRHTTVNAVLLPLACGGAVIDSPGVRDFAPAFAQAVDVAHGYREIATRARECRFANCLHLREPGCAVKGAVDTGVIDARRYASYRRSMNLFDDSRRSY